MNDKLFETIQKGNIIVKHVNLSFSISDRNKKIIDEIWIEECKKRPNLFNGETLSFLSIKKENNNIIVSGQFTDYKNALVSRNKPDLGLNIIQIGVSGITLIEENNKKFILFSIRTDKVTDYPGYIELVPSGNIDKSVLLKDGTIDYVTKLKEEFFEETGVPTKYIKKIKSICLAYDCSNQVFDVGCSIELTVGKNEIIKTFSKVTEYKNPQFIQIDDLENFINKNKIRLVPTSLAILECFFDTKP